MKRAIAAMVLAYLVPGAGHVYLGRRRRGAAFLAIVVLMFGVGIAIDGSMYVLTGDRGQLLNVFAAVGSMGVGPLYFLARAFGPEGSIRTEMFEYGRTFTLTAGLMNLLLVLDCWDIAMRGKA
jgi:TM2 domain-containing membrane protein YozV